MKNTPKSIGLEDASFSISESRVALLKEKAGKKAVIGQPRALQALRMGTAIRGKGYNIFVTGRAGTGRHTAITGIVKEYTAAETSRRDIVYVYNFQQPDKPKVLYFGPGKAAEFKKKIHQLVENLKMTIKSRLDSVSFKEQRDEIVDIIERQENGQLSKFESVLSKEGFQIIYVQEEEGRATDITPVFNGEPVTFEQLQTLVRTGDVSEEEWKNYREKYYKYMDEMKKIFTELRGARAAMAEELEALRIETARPAITAEIEIVRRQFTDDAVLSYLAELEEDLTENLYLFLLDGELTDELGNPKLIRYGVNVIEDCSATEETFPVIFENHPSYTNLFGNIDVRTESGGESRTSFMMIQAGSIVKASGGFLVMNAGDLLREPDSWYHLKRALQSGKVEIQHRQGAYMWAGSLLKPEAIDIDVKVILLGEEGMYDALYVQDPDFKKLFKMHAEFSDVMERTEDAVVQYITFIETLAREQGLRQPDSSGTAAVIEYGVRLAEDKNKLSTRFSRITDCILEADYQAGKAGKSCIDRESVLEAMRVKEYLSGSIEEQIDEMISRGDVLVSLGGKENGRVNGLAMYDRGYYAFGRPAVISARVSPGERGVVNIEREAGLSGEIHNKGILILEGFLRSTYAEAIPLSVHASICFEQSYGEIDGDSASSTEIYALLSALSGAALRQDIAVTGSVNQMGQIQPVGGITEKVEGFYRICRKLGLSGSQGVIIPKQNVRNLVLSADVCAAVGEGSFGIYPVETIDDGIEILTGMEAGVKTRGSFPEGTVNRLVEDRLKEMAEQVRKYHHFS
jgi:predicted ATP-dependent protease